MCLGALLHIRICVGGEKRPFSFERTLYIILLWMGVHNRIYVFFYTDHWCQKEIKQVVWFGINQSIIALRITQFSFSYLGWIGFTTYFWFYFSPPSFRSKFSIPSNCCNIYIYIYIYIYICFEFIANNSYYYVSK